MDCPTCHIRLEHPGQGHSCLGGSVPAPKLPATWVAGHVAATAAAGIMAVFCLVRAAILAGLIAAPEWFDTTRLSIVVSVMLLAGLIVWSRLTASVVTKLGGWVTVIRNRTLATGWTVVVFSYAWLSSNNTWVQCARALGSVLIIAGMLVSRAKLLRWLAEPRTPSGAVPLGPAAAMARVPQPPQRMIPQIGDPIPWQPLPTEPQPRDWDASAWDPDVQADIERRRRRGTPSD